MPGVCIGVRCGYSARAHARTRARAHIRNRVTHSGRAYGCVGSASVLYYHVKQRGRLVGRVVAAPVRQDSCGGRMCLYLFDPLCRVLDLLWVCFCQWLPITLHRANQAGCISTDSSATWCAAAGYPFTAQCPGRKDMCASDANKTGWQGRGTGKNANHMLGDNVKSTSTPGHRVEEGGCLLPACTHGHLR